MDSLTGNLMQLGLKEYEARIYVALASLGEANVRRIHEASGVPRPRVYDVLSALAARGFIDIRQGSPLMYSAVRPDLVISYLEKELASAAEESRRALADLSPAGADQYSPIWYVQSDRTIHRYLEMLVEGVARELTILCFNPETLGKFQAPIAGIARDRMVKILFPRGRIEGIALPEGALCYEAGTLKNIFGMNIFEQVYQAPIRREGGVFRLECIFLADDRESMLIYSLDGKRMAVTITLPFITAVQAELFGQLIARSRRAAGCSTAVPGQVRRKREIAGKTRTGRRR
jgi:HTH-type transcriptional regulator, sugar sensing transcriptional regulator